MPYLAVFKELLGCKTLGDIDRLLKEYAEAAYQIACYQISLTDLDIIASSIAPQDVCIAYILKTGGGKPGLRRLFDELYGPSDSNDMLAESLLEEARDLPFMNR